MNKFIHYIIYKKNKKIKRHLLAEVENYREDGKDIVEKSFRQIKGVLSLHPIRVKLLDRVSAHVKICYLAYCILSLLKYKFRTTDLRLCI